MAKEERPRTEFKHLPIEWMRDNFSLKGTSPFWDLPLSQAPSYLLANTNLRNAKAFYYKWMDNLVDRLQHRGHGFRLFLAIPLFWSTFMMIGFNRGLTLKGKQQDPKPIIPSKMKTD